MGFVLNYLSWLCKKEKYVDGQVEKVNTSHSALGNLDRYMGQSFTLSNDIILFHNWPCFSELKKSLHHLHTS